VDLRTTVLLDRHARPWAGHPRLPLPGSGIGVDRRADPRVEPGDGHDGEPGAARLIAYANTEIVIEAESPSGGYVPSTA
jgi:hypothetical protein